MKSCKKILLLLTPVVLLFPLIGHTQLPAKQTNKAAFKKEFYGGLTLHSSGWGGTFTYSKFLTAKTKRLFSFDIVSMKHPKEVKIKGALDENAKNYVYGKLNGLTVIRFGYGKKILLAEKLRDKGVQVGFSYSFGPSVGLAKPVYLDVVKILSGGRVTVATEKYDPEEHNLGNIYGKARGARGLAETKFYPGAFIKSGIDFEFGKQRAFIRNIEVGAILDGYPWRVPVMTEVKNPFLFPNVYLNLQIGRRHF